jgi:SOS-response transcriptional repressor LexA
MYHDLGRAMDFQEKIETLMKRNGIRYITDLAKAVTGEDPLSHRTKTNFNRYVKHGVRMPDNLREPLATVLDTTVDYLFTSGDKEQRVGFIPMIGKSSTAVPDGAFLYTTSLPVLPEYSGDNFYMIEAADDSMSPLIVYGMYVICNRDAGIQNGDTVHFTHNGASSIRKYYRDASGAVTLVPLTLNVFEPIVVGRNENSGLKMSRCVCIMGKI